MKIAARKGLPLYIGTKAIHAIPKMRMVIDSPDLSEAGYEVIYEDGYVSWSPKQAFELAYRKNGSLTFGEAYAAAMSGYRIRNRNWNGKDMWIYYWHPGLINDDFSIHEHAGMAGTMTSMFMMKGANNELFPWTPNQLDLTRAEWEVHPDDLLPRVEFPVFIYYDEVSRRHTAVLPDYHNLEIPCGPSRCDIRPYIVSFLSFSMERGKLVEVVHTPRYIPEDWYDKVREYNGKMGYWVRVKLQPALLQRSLDKYQPVQEDDGA